MKYRILLSIMCGLVVQLQAGETPIPVQVVVPSFIQKEYDRLLQRLEVFPELQKLFIEIHVPEARNVRGLYAKRRIILGQAIHRYELSPILIRDIERFNKKMRPRIRRVWWKKKGFWVPILLVATAAVATGSGIALYRRKKSAVEEVGAKQLTTNSSTTSSKPAVVAGRHTSFDNTALSFAGTGLSFSPNDDSGVTGSAGAGSASSEVSAGAAGIVVSDVDPRVTGIVITPATIDAHLKVLGSNPGGGVEVNGVMTFPDVPFFREFAKPDNEMPWGTERLYKNKSFSYKKNELIWDMRQKACEIAMSLARANTELAEQIIAEENSLTANKGRSRGFSATVSRYRTIPNADQRLRIIIERYTIITHMIMCFEQEKDGTGREFLKTFLSADLLDQMVRVTQLYQSGFIISSFGENAGFNRAVSLIVKVAVALAARSNDMVGRKESFDSQILAKYVSGKPGLTLLATGEKIQ